MIVLDASALVEVLVFGRRGAEVQRQLERASVVFAPDLIYVEVVSAIWWLVRAGELPAVDAETAIGDLATLPLRVVSHRDLATRAWQLREAARVTDAFYLACAEALSATLVTTDARLARGHHGASVTLVA